MTHQRSHRSRSHRLGTACLETLEDRRLLSFSPAGNYASTLRPYAIATADFNGDGRLDLATTVGIDTNSKVSVRMGDGAGGFGAAQEIAAPAWGGGIGNLFVADLNNDTKPDLALSDGINGYRTLIGNGDGTFQTSVETVGYGLVYAGHLQPGNAVAGIRTYMDGDWNTHVELLWGNGQGGFTPQGGDGQYSGWSERMAPINLNDDPYLDVVTGDGTVFTGNIWGGLSYDWNQTPPLSGGAVATGDFTGDGWDDVVVASGSVAILRNNGDGTLAAPILHPSNGVALSAIATADFNADGKLDVIVTDNEKATVSVMLGNGDGTLSFAGAFAVGTSPSSVTVGDFNGDGRPDVAVANNSSFNSSVLLNDGIWTTVPPTPTTLSIGDTTVTEGNTGTANATFTVTLSKAAAVDVSVNYNTANISALVGSDYAAASGTVIIPAGQTSSTFTVAVKGDRVAEPTETFAVELSSPTNATIVDSQGIGTILDDEPRISIGDVSRSEGRKGKSTLFTFTVTLSAAYDQPVTMSFRTVDGTAKSGDQDYVSKTGSLTFNPGETSKTITVSVKGDSRREANETFYLDLFGNSGNSLFSKNRGIGTILNDD